MKMPFEVLMEHVAALTDEGKELPMGKLSERWGEPASRIADAIDAVRVMRGECTYVTVRPERERREWNPAEAESIRRTWAANARQAESRAAPVELLASPRRLRCGLCRQSGSLLTPGAIWRGDLSRNP